VALSGATRNLQISGDLFGFLWKHLEAHPIGRVFHGRTDVVLSNELSRESGDVLTTPLLPGFELARARLFRE
jgi:hypothetical protein